MQKHIKLPHIDAFGHYQFVTFRTDESVDEYVSKILNERNLKSSVRQYKIDTYLDGSINGAFLNGSVLEYLYNFLKSLNDDIYELISFVIMPNHVHVLFKQISSLQDTIRIIKSKSARDINNMLKRNGKFWASEYYDKVIRDEEHFVKVYEYIKNNAPKAGLNLDGRFYSKYESD
ncbi:MAG: transposase [Sulfurimonas sp.]|uniref:transposase n=1 Tax=Sulfurimonas sp. TaxID=2022749 RepID=UPI003D09C048